jgi:hypothetical protein
MTAEQLEEHFPFLALLKYCEHEHVGIISNADEKTITFYDYTLLRDEDAKRLFIEYGNIWWWESNRRIPINIFMQGKMSVFGYTITSFNAKHTTLIFGHMVSLSSLLKKSKRKTIQLIRQ